VQRCSNRRFRSIHATLTIVALLTCPHYLGLGAQHTSSSPDTKEIEQRIKKELEDGDFPSINVGIVREDKLVYAQSFGVADRKSGKPATLNTLYRVGSVGKLFTATLLMILRDKGVVRLDDPVEKYLPPEIKLQTDARGAPAITLRHLVTHTSGLPEWDKDDSRIYETPGPSSEVERYRSVTESKLEFPVGAYFGYSGLGYSLLGHALERAASKPYEELLKDLLFKPLGMNDTTITLSAEQRTRVPVQYRWDGSEVVRKPNDPDGNGNRFYWPTSSHYSTVPDLARFLSLQLRVGEAKVEPVSGATLLEMQTPQRLENDWNLAIGVGWWIEPSDELGSIVWHKGGSAGCSSFIGFSPRYKVGVVVLANRNRSTEEIGRWLLSRAVQMYALKSTPSEAEAAAFFTRRDWLNAAWAYQSVTERSPQNAEAWHRLGSSLHRLRRYDQAIQAYSRAVELGVKDEYLPYLLARCYAMKSQKDEAFKWLWKAIEVGFKDSDNELSTEPELDNLRDDPRFKMVRDKIRERQRQGSSKG
jgi:CubicO group peptidase (beta-lactamase class C family)